MKRLNMMWVVLTANAARPQALVVVLIRFKQAIATGIAVNFGTFRLEEVQQPRAIFIYLASSIQIQSLVVLPGSASTTRVALLLLLQLNKH